MQKQRTGKGKGKHFEDMAAKKFRTGSGAKGGAAGASSAADDNQFPGALRKGSYMMAKMRNQNVYKLAKIVEVRIDESANEDYMGILPKSIKAENPIEAPKDQAPTNEEDKSSLMEVDE